MSRFLRPTLIALAVLIALGWLAFSYLTAREDPPATSSYALDMAAVRAQAAALPGSRPLRVRSLRLVETETPRGAIFAGESFEPHTLVNHVFQIVLPDETLVVDTGYSREGAASSRGGGSYDEVPYARLYKAMAEARAIVVTHEHADHIGGVADAPEPSALVGRLLLSAEQLGNAGALDRAGIPETLRGQLEPLRYDRMHALAPGVVLIKAAGHTRGTQMIYVQLEDGRELLLLGDVVWHMDAIRNLHYRPRFVTDLILDEDREAVLNQIRRLHDLMSEEPGLQLLPSHDKPQRAALLADGLLLDGFED